MKIVVTRRAEKQFASLKLGIAKRIRQKIGQYAIHPESLAHQVTRLKGSGYLRLRVGDYRVIFSEDGVVMLIVEVGHRREIYR